MKSFLYRGVTLQPTDFYAGSYKETVLKPHKTPYTGDDGRVYAPEGNEYGVYMSDNIECAVKAYGTPSSFGLMLHPRTSFRVDGSTHYLMMPEIGIVYRINPNKAINVRKPYISKCWSGHYNNGYEGDEWIADELPADSYEIIQITIGADSLHDAVVFNHAAAQQHKLISEMVKVRMHRLSILQHYIEELPKDVRILLTKEDFTMFRHLFGAENISNLLPNEIPRSNPENDARYLLCTMWHSQMPVKQLRYASALLTRADTEQTSLPALINADIAQVQQNIVRAKERAQMQNRVFDATKLNQKIDFYQSVMDLLD